MLIKGDFESITFAIIGRQTTLAQQTKVEDITENNGSFSSIEIAEPDDIDELLLSPTEPFNNSSNSFVIEEDVHTLSPSPLPDYIRSPSLQIHRFNASTPKSNSSYSSNSPKSREKLHEKYASRNFSRSITSPCEPKNDRNSSSKYRQNEVVRSEIEFFGRTSSSKYKEQVSSTLSNLDVNSHREYSSHAPDRYEKNYHKSKRSSKQEQDLSPGVHSHKRHARSSRSRSGESDRSRSYNRSSKYDSEKTIRRDSVSRVNRRSISTERQGTRQVRSSRFCEYPSSDEHRDSSPQIGRPYLESSRSRFEKSSSRDKSIDQDIQYRLSNDSPDSLSTGLPHQNADFKKDSLISPKNETAFKNNTLNLPSLSSSSRLDLLESNSFNSANHDLLICSPHSSISDISLKSMDNSFSKDIKSPEKPLQEKNGVALQKQNNGKDIPEELFQALSPLDDISDIDEDNIHFVDTDTLNHVVSLKTNENYEQISLSSGSLLNEKITDTTKDENGKYLEVISSDEEYEENLNAALTSDKIECTNLGGNVCEDDELDNLNPNASLFDPFCVDQLKPLKFLFNSNNSTTFIDMKLFNKIMKFVNEKFSEIYSNEHEGSPEPRRELINEHWVQNVEQLASDIMKLASPIYYNFSSDDCLVNTEDDLRNLVSILISITIDGLDFDLATSQKLSPFKVRHLKAGIKLFISLFSSLDLRSDTSDLKLMDILLQKDLPLHLISLYDKPHMTLSLRLMILNGLIVMADYAQGARYLFEKKLPLPKEEECLTIYQFLLKSLLDNLKTRATSVFEELLDKIHLFKLFQELSIQIENSSEQLPTMVSQLVTLFKRFSNRIHRPVRLLPSISQYEIKTAVHSSIPLLLLTSSLLPLTAKHTTSNELFDCIKIRFSCKHVSCSSSKFSHFSLKSFYNYLQHFDLLSLMSSLLTTSNQLLVQYPADNARIQLYSILSDHVIALLNLLVSHQNGLKFLLQDHQNVAHVNSIHRLLVQPKNLENLELVAKRLKNKMIDFGVIFVTK